MASASCQDKTLHCPICVEVYKEPRKLPGCSHSFCERCILTYVLNLKKEENLGQQFPCPVCRLPTQVPADVNIDIDWIRAMDKDADLVKNLNKMVIEAGDTSCGPCKFLSKNTDATHYCMNCQEYLCSVCSVTLHACKLNRDHTVIEIITDDKTKTVHTSALKLMSQLLTCSEHPENLIKIYCKFHDVLVCSICAALKHVNCLDLKEIKEIPKTSMEAESSSLIDASKKIVEHLKLINDVYRENETENSQDVEKIRTQLQDMKQRIIKLLEQLEDKLNEESGALAKQSTLRCLDEIDKLKEMTKKIKVFTHLLQNCLAVASDEHSFICIKKIKWEFQEIEQNLIKEGTEFTKIGVELKTHELYEELLQIGQNDNTRFATVMEKTAVVEISPYRNAELQKSYNYEKVLSKVIISGGKCSPTYNGILYLPNHKVVLVDSDNGFCHLVGENYQKATSRELYSASFASGYLERPLYATYLEHNMIAVSLAGEKEICFLSPEDLSLIGKVKCSRSPMAICAVNRFDIAVSWKNPVAFSIITEQWGSYSEKNYLDGDTSGREFISFNYMAINKGLQHVIQPCYIDKAVYCFQFNGDPVFTYKHEELQKPNGTAVDSSGNIYICCQQSPGIHVLSRFGLLIKIVKENCPPTPLAIGFCEDGSHFAVTQFKYEMVHFFTVKESN